MTSHNLTMRIKVGVLAVSVTGLLVGCVVTNARRRSEHAAQAGTSVTDTGLVEYVVLLAESTGGNWGVPGHLAPLWNPTTNDVVEALNQLPDYLQHARSQPSAHPAYAEKLPLLREWLPQTICQNVGVTFDGRKGILLNCIPSHSQMSAGWKERFIKVYDGGPRWWSVVYLPEERKFTRLHIDLGF